MAQFKIRITLAMSSFLAIILMAMGIVISSPYPWIAAVVMLLLVYIFVYSQAYPSNYLQPGCIYELVHYDSHGQETKLIVFRVANKWGYLIIPEKVKFQDDPRVGQKFLARVDYEGDLVLCAVNKKRA